MSNPNTRKSCVVPKCTNTTTNAPEKLFFLVPMEMQMRKQWIKAMKRQDPFGDKSKVYCCEDHVDIESDMENYVKYRMVGGRIKLKTGTVPHKFKCQKQNKDKPDRSSQKKRNQTTVLDKLLGKDEDMENYVKYRMVGGRIKLKTGTVPHKFKCQKQNKDKPDRSSQKKQNQTTVFDKLLSKDEKTTTSAIAMTGKSEEVLVASSEDKTIIKDPLSFDNNDSDHLIISKKSKGVQVNLKDKGVNKSTITEEKYFKRKRKKKLGPDKVSYYSMTDTSSSTNKM